VWAVGDERFVSARFLTPEYLFSSPKAHTGPQLTLPTVPARGSDEHGGTPGAGGRDETYVPRRHRGCSPLRPPPEQRRPNSAVRTASFEQRLGLKPSVGLSTSRPQGNPSFPPLLPPGPMGQGASDRLNYRPEPWRNHCRPRWAGKDWSARICQLGICREFLSIRHLVPTRTPTPSRCCVPGGSGVSQGRAIPPT
jgi:hypothetical protein